MKFYIILFLFASCLCVDAGVKPRGWRGGIRPPVSGAVAHLHSPMRVGLRSLAPLECIGSPQVPVILVEWNDRRFAEHEGMSVVEFYDRFCNGDGVSDLYSGAGSYGAVSEYFRDQSDGGFTPHFSVMGPVTLSMTYRYYGQNWDGVTDVNVDDFYEEAVEMAGMECGVDWSDFDNDGDGVVDMVMFLFAGKGESESEDRDEDAIWPCENEDGGWVGGVRFGCFACCNETFGGVADGIGIMCHEMSHALGLPDFYDVNYVAFGMDYWDLMDAGNYCNDGYTPCGYSAYERDFMGWRSLKTLNLDAGGEITLYPMSSDEGCGYRITCKDDPDRFYILENRQNVEWDRYIGYGSDDYGLHHGLLVTYVDYDMGVWRANKVNTSAAHQRMTVVPADGKLESSMYAGEGENCWYTYYNYALSMGGDPFPGIGYTRQDNGFCFSPVDSLRTDDWAITDIKEHVDGTVTLTWCGGSGSGVESLEQESDEEKVGDVYDLSGKMMKMSSFGVQNGNFGKIYLINGKKVLMK